MKHSPTRPQHYHHDVTAIILSGGRGERMNGQDKGLVKYQNSTLAETTICILKPQVRDIIISCNRNLEDYKRFGFLIASDQSNKLHCEKYPGPIAGILSAIELVQTQYIQLCPCDTPNIPDNLVDLLMDQLTVQQRIAFQDSSNHNTVFRNQADHNNKAQNITDEEINAPDGSFTQEKAPPLIAVPFDGERLQPLHALIHTQLILSLAQYFHEGGRKIRDWISAQAAIEVDVSNHRIKFRNINRQEDLQA